MPLLDISCLALTSCLCLKTRCFLSLLPSTTGRQVVVETTRSKTVQEVYDNTLLFFSNLVLLSQNVTMPTTGDETDGKVWVTLLPVFVYMEALLTVVMYPGMSVELLILIREDTFLLIRKIINDPLWKSTIDSVILEVSDRFEEILLDYDLKMSYPGSGGKANVRVTTFDVFTESGNETSNDGSSFPSHGDSELHKQIDTLVRPLRTSWCLLLHRVSSGGFETKRGQDDIRTRSNWRGRSGSRSCESSSGHPCSGSKNHVHTKRVNYDSDHYLYRVGGRIQNSAITGVLYHCCLL